MEFESKVDAFVMLSPAYLRHQADNCLRIARSCFDLGSAERLRLMATELRAKAAEMEGNSPLRTTAGAASSCDNDRG